MLFKVLCNFGVEFENLQEPFFESLNIFKNIHGLNTGHSMNHLKSYLSEFCKAVHFLKKKYIYWERFIEMCILMKIMHRHMLYCDIDVIR